MIPPKEELTTPLVPADKYYVLVSIMEEPVWSNSGMEDWDFEDFGDCECGGPPPPTFMIPPPPRPPGPLPDALGVLQDLGEEIISGMCPASMILATEDPKPSSAEAPIMAVIISACAFVVVIVVACIVFRYRSRLKSSKPSSDADGTIIANDLAFSSSQPQTGFKPVAVVRPEDLGLHVGLHHYTPEPHSSSASEHLYQSISSGSETYSYSTSDSTYQNQGCSLSAMSPCQRSCYQLPGSRRAAAAHQRQPSHRHHQVGAKPENKDPSPQTVAPQLPPRTDLNVISLTMHCHTPSSCNSTLQSQTHHHVHCLPANLKTNNTIYSCYTSQVTPCYTPHHTLCCALTHQGNYYPSQNDQAPDSESDSIFKISGRHNDRPPSFLAERGLPPLPSRVESFRNHFNGDRGGSYRNGSGRPDDTEYPPPDLRRNRLNNSWHSSTGRCRSLPKSDLSNQLPQNHNELVYEAMP